MTELDVGAARFATTLESHRLQMLQQASMAICSPGVLPLTEQFDAVPRLSALLTASLEELRVAAEEISHQEEALAEWRADTERQLSHYRMLFEVSPIPSLVTDRNSDIREVNTAMCALLRLGPDSLYRRPLAAHVARAERQGFVAGLARLALTNGASNWLISLERHGDAPIAASASVTLLPDRAVGSASLLWHFHPNVDD
jgi:PAS domain-containing protein